MNYQTEIEQMSREAAIWRKRAKEANRRIAIADRIDALDDDEKDLEALALGNYRYR